MKKQAPEPVVVVRRPSLPARDIDSAKVEPHEPNELECWSCGVHAPAGSPGWENDTARSATLGRRIFCPKHRRQSPALASLGELVQSKRAREQESAESAKFRKDRHAHPKDR